MLDASASPPSETLPVLCRLCGGCLAAEDSFVMVGPATLHFACWIARVLERQARYDPPGRLAEYHGADLALVGLEIR
jgi:hypothetical protein